MVDAARVNLTGDGLEKVPVGKQATFFIEGQTEMGDPEVKVLSPSRKIVPSSIRFVGEGHYGVDYHPVDVGDHQVEVKISDLHVHGSPFVVKAYDATKGNDHLFFKQILLPLFLLLTFSVSIIHFYK